MRTRVLRAALLALVAAGPLQAADAPSPARAEAAGTTISLALDPAHPTRKQDTSLRLTFTDTATGKPVAVSDVQIQWSMDGKKHADKIAAKRTAEPGEYTAKSIAPMSGSHNLIVTAVRDGEPIAATFPTHVMDVTKGMKDTMGH